MSPAASPNRLAEDQAGRIVGRKDGSRSQERARRKVLGFGMLVWMEATMGMWSEVGRSLVLVFLNVYRNDLQAHGITIVAFHPKVFRVSLFIF